MWAWLLSLFRSPIQWVVSIVFSLVIQKIQDYFSEQMKRKEAERIAKENLQKYQEALKKGDPDEIARIGEDLLNGIDHNP